MLTHWGEQPGSFIIYLIAQQEIEVCRPQCSGGLDLISNPYNEKPKTMKNNILSIHNESSLQYLSLDEIMRLATSDCESMMHDHGRVSPTIRTFLRSRSSLSFNPEKGSVAGTDQFELARQFAICFRAQAIVLVLPEWPDSQQRREILDLPPSEFPHCREVIFITAESREGCARLLLFPQRNAAGEFTGFSTEDPGIFDEDFLIGILPDADPTDADAAEAQKRLSDMGIKF